MPKFVPSNRKLGAKIPALALTSKTGLVFILDRRTGKPLYDVEERPVPQSEIPGEHTWPTEPFPVKPAPLSLMTFTPDDLAKVTPEHEAFCRELFSQDGGMSFGDPFNPYGLKTTINFPGTPGAPVACTGEYAWRVPLGVVEELEAKGIKNTGTMNMGGSVSTAGGLVFIAATNDRRFRAFEAKTGKVVWETQLESGGYASPITYQGKDGKQYVLIVATGGGYYDRKPGDSVIAFALPWRLVLKELLGMGRDLYWRSACVA